MDELKAYKILGLEPNASREEIKEAYAKLSKEFHPEEYPEEFQQIYEAYRVLGRTFRRAGRTENPEPEKVEGQQKIHREPQAVKITFDKSAEVQNEQYDFEETLKQAQKTEQQMIHEEVLRAEAEFRVLMQPEYRKKTKMFSAFFKKEEYKRALASREFVGKLAVLIEESNLKKKVYREIASYYRLQDKEPEKLVPEGQALYRALDQKIDIKGGASVAQGAIPVGVMAGLWAGIRPFARMFDQLGMMILFVAFIAGGVCIYRTCRKKRAHVFAQVITLVYVNVILFIAYVSEIWTAAVGGEENMLSVVSNCLILSLGWIMILFLYSVIKEIKKRKK